MIGKRKFATGTKRIFTLIISVITVFSLLPLTGCEKEKKIEDYPEPEIIETENTSPSEMTEIMEVAEDFSDEMTEEEFEELIAIPDPFESNHFVYCPDAIPVSLARGFRDKPKIIINAKYILQAVYEGKNNVEVPEKDAISNHDFQAAIDLAKLSNPIAAGIDGGNSEDGTAFFIMNFPRIILHGDEVAGDEVEVEEADADEIKSKSESLLDYVVDTINNNVSPEDSDIEKAEAVYKALASDFTPVMREQNVTEYVIDDDGTAYVQPTLSHTLIEDFPKGELDNLEISQLYQFILTQLNIECMTVASYGNYTSQNVEELDDLMSGDWYEVWNVVVCDGKAYNCDLFFEIAVLQKQRIKNQYADPDITYFGMSDALRNKSFEANKEKLAEYTFKDPYETEACQVKGSIVPVCAEDYYLR
ncbi:MAG: hypothetical protein IKS60_08780 [Lachnospiraceae bacterium]|nr:hypothetical protein [Lachnospiraceae bacterium]MBR5917201.1 hypothetical protein [Lachnospiraceae bacterium]